MDEERGMARLLGIFTGVRLRIKIDKRSIRIRCIRREVRAGTIIGVGYRSLISFQHEISNTNLAFLFSLALIILHRRTQIPPPNPPPTSPPHPSLLPRPLNEAKHQRRPNKPHTRTTTPYPPTSRIQTISHRRANQLPTEHTKHIRRINSIPRLRLNSINSRPISNLTRLQPQIDHKSLYDRSSESESAGICPNSDTGNADDFADDDGVEGGDLVDYETRVRWAEAHCEDAYEGEEADVEG